MRASIRAGSNTDFVMHLETHRLQRAWGLVLAQEGVLVRLRLCSQNTVWQKVVAVPGGTVRGALGAVIQN